MIMMIINIILICLGVFVAARIAVFIFREIAADIIKEKKKNVADRSNSAGIPKMSEDPRTSGSTKPDGSQTSGSTEPDGPKEDSGTDLPEKE